MQNTFVTYSPYDFSAQNCQIKKLRCTLNSDLLLMLKKCAQLLRYSTVQPGYILSTDSLLQTNIIRPTVVIVL